MYSPSFRIWGYETNWGSFAQFTKVQGQQCMPKPKHMTWEELGLHPGGRDRVADAARLGRERRQEG
jgi:hypothetical protein